MTAPTATKQRGRPFQPGRSGNPAGRPAGARNKASLAVEALLDGQAEAITQKAIEAALAGDMVAVRLVLDRIAPPRRSRPISIELPPVSDASGIAQAQAEVVRAASQGELLLDEATALSGLLEGRRKALETQELEARIRRLEGDHGLA
jgi:hypothetical protein